MIPFLFAVISLVIAGLRIGGLFHEVTLMKLNLLKDTAHIWCGILIGIILQAKYVVGQLKRQGHDAIDDNNMTKGWLVFLIVVELGCFGAGKLGLVHPNVPSRDLAIQQLQIGAFELEKDSTVLRGRIGEMEERLDSDEHKVEIAIGVLNKNTAKLASQGPQVELTDIGNLSNSITELQRSQQKQDKRLDDIESQPLVPVPAPTPVSEAPVQVMVPPHEEAHSIVSPPKRMPTFQPRAFRFPILRCR